MLLAIKGNSSLYRYLWKVLKAVLSHKLLLKTHQYLNYMPECTCILCNICIYTKKGIKNIKKVFNVPLV